MKLRLAMLATLLLHTSIYAQKNTIPNSYQPMKLNAGIVTEKFAATQAF